MSITLGMVKPLYSTNAILQHMGYPILTKERECGVS